MSAFEGEYLMITERPLRSPNVIEQHYMILEQCSAIQLSVISQLFALQERFRVH